MKLPRFEPFLPYQDNVLRWAFQREDYPDISVDAVLENLSSLEKYIFEQYAKEYRTQKSIADELNKSTENTRQHLVKAFRKIRHTAELIDSKMKLQMALESYSYDPDDPGFIMLLNLSVRAFNCLYRARICSFNQIKNAIETGKLYNIRNLGVASEIEIMKKFNEKCKELFDGTFEAQDYVRPKILDKIEIARKEFKDMNLQTCAFNALVRADIYTMEELIRKFMSGELFEVANLGHTSIEHIHKYFFQNGYFVVKEKESAEECLKNDICPTGGDCGVEVF